MDIVIICNGLGNQMSQYAFFLKKKSLDKSSRFIFDRKSWSDHNGYELNRVFNVDYKETIVNRILYLIFRILGIKKIPLLSRPLIRLMNIMGISLINEPFNYDFNREYLTPSRGLRFFYGGWHSEKYFIDEKNKIVETFQFEVDNDDNISKSLTHIKNTNSVSIHVRRGDYLSEVNMKTFGAVCQGNYYEKAIEKMQSLVVDPHFFVFSNDVAWVLENLKYKNLTIINYNSGQDSWKDMYLMSQCKHNINSNSSFSWWGAWLNKQEEKIVIVPKFFINEVITKDVYPESWIVLNDYD